MNRELHNEIKSYLDALYELDGFVGMMERPSSTSWYNFTMQNHIYDAGICFYSGSTKGVIVIDGCDYVIKVPFLYITSWDWGEDGRKHTTRIDKEFDYCALEWRNYCEASTLDIEHCFASMDYWGRYHGCPIYIQERCECNEDEITDAIYSSHGRNCDSCSCSDCSCCGSYYDDEDDYENMGALTDEFWGHHIAREFWDYTDTNRINDLHSGNWSIEDGCLKVVDYSGYNLDESYWEVNRFDVCYRR